MINVILTLFNSKGKFFWKNGDRYEGEFKNGKKHGQGKKEVIYFMIYVFYYCLMILQVNGQEIMETNMKASGKMIKSIAHVRKNC